LAERPGVASQTMPALLEKSQKRKPILG
jgi:hypothetical protein